MSRRETRTLVEYTLPVTIDRRGHDPVIPRGYAVKCVYDNSVNLYDDLDSEKERPYPFPEERRVTMHDAGVGLVCDHRYHVPYLELCRARLDPVYDSTRKVHHLIDVTEDLWYYVMFRKGYFWARFDWLEVVTQPVDVESAGALSQAPPPG